MDQCAHEIRSAVHIRLGVNQIVSQKKILVVCDRDTVPDRDTEIGLAPVHDFLTEFRSVVRNSGANVDIIVLGKGGDGLGETA